MKSLWGGAGGRRPRPRPRSAHESKPYKARPGAAVEAVNDIRKVIGEVSEAALGHWRCGGRAIGSDQRDPRAIPIRPLRGTSRWQRPLRRVEAQVVSAAEAARSVSEGSSISTRAFRQYCPADSPVFLDKLRAA